MAQNQRLSTTLQLDAVLTSGYKDAFKSAGDLTNDLKKQTTDLKKQLNAIGKEADALDAVGKSSDDLRRDFSRLERQIKETEKATERFSNARKHFRSASIGARALKNDLGSIADTVKTAALAIAGISAAAAVALSPDEELLNFEQTLAGLRFLAPDIDETGIQDAKSLILDLSNAYGTAANEIAHQHEQLTRNLGFEGAQQSIQAAVEFQAVTGLAITEIEEELATARISLGIDTAAETQEFLQLLQGAHRAGIKIDNIDLGDLETLRKRVGEDVFGENFQREFLTTIAFRQVDSFQFADYAQAFQEEIERATLITPEIRMDEKALAKAEESIQTLAKWGIRAEDGLLGAMQVYQQLSDAGQVQFFTELEPVLTAMPAEVIARGSEVLPEIQQQVDTILTSGVSMEDAASDIASSWAGAWGRIDTIAQNTRGVLQQAFAETFGGVIVENAERFFNFISEHQGEIQNFFTGIKDGISPVISKIWNTAREAYPDIKQFAVDVWAELKRQFDAVSPVLEWVTDKIIGIVKAVAGFAREHPRLVATLITGIAAWKAYRLASDTVKVGLDAFGGVTNLAAGHLHRIRAIAISASPAFTTMGASLFGALAPALPVILPIVGGVAALGAAAYVVYRNWTPISEFFTAHFETIRNVLMFVFPPLGMLVGFAGVIKDNWASISEFFATLWETITLAAKVAFEGIQFVALSGVMFVKQAWAGIGKFFGSVWNSIRDFFMNSPLAPIFTWMVGGVKQVVSPLLNFFGNFWQNVSDMAGQAIDWIIDKFEFVNKVLDKAFGWLKKENAELKAELGITIDTPKIEVGGVDIPDVELPENIAIDKPAIDAPVIETPSVELPSVDVPKVETSTPESTQTPQSQSVRVQRDSHQWDLVKIGLGQLKEVTKQTKLLENILPLTVIPEMPQSPTLETNPFENVANVDIAPIAVESPSVDLQTPDVSLDAPAMVAETPELTLDPYVAPTIEPMGSSGDVSTQTTTQATTAPRIEVVNNFNISADADTDIDALANLIAERVKQSIEQETELYYAS